MALKPNLIGGAWVDSSDEAENINPSDVSDCGGTFARADRAQVEQAIAAAFPAWSRSSPQQRFDVLDAAGGEILARKAETRRAARARRGQDPCRRGDGGGARGQLFKFFAGEAIRFGGERLPSVRPGVEVEIMREPLGTIGLITP